MADLSSISALLIEAHPNMRTQLRNMLAEVGIQKIQMAVSAGAAVRKLREMSFDLILCEYHIGDGQDGQHLLEDLRHNHIIPLRTLFIMVTGERQYEKVVSAAELAPNDYLLKPFAADALFTRISRAVVKRAAFLPIYKLIEADDTPAAIAACIEAEATHPQYQIDFMRLRAELHVAAGEADEAEALYTQVLELRAVPWARLGLAKALYMKQRFAQAEELLTELVEENEHFIDAYDWLARTREAAGELEQARDVLLQARAVSPHRLSRLRRLGGIALDMGDATTAESVLAEVVRKGKYSDFRDPEDHVWLVQAQIGTGNLEAAAATLRDLDKSMGSTEGGRMCTALSSAMLHTQVGDADKARAAIEVALGESRRLGKVSLGLKQELARACFDNGLEDAGKDVVLDIMRTAENPRAVDKTQQMLKSRGHAELAQSLQKQVHDEVRSLVATGAEKAKAGDFDGAVEEMLNAVNKMPNNTHVLFNAALALLRHIENCGWNEKFSAQARSLIERVRRLDPANARLPALIDLHRKLQVKFGIGGVHV
ncbi:response regulator [Nitrogeniibacter mangrovi]|uniref:Response regulator n=1 Tax=Nitrogeniibacter mangrovi TaxID=2016596 RepID=A0A6C1B8E4_9RHOO|nr:response regulator [Nitrogeniibacter mangrovi]QID18514.1 response regulator [Nitrogeniibacter mangrovi]